MATTECVERMGQSINNDLLLSLTYTLRPSGKPWSEEDAFDALSDIGLHRITHHGRTCRRTLLEPLRPEGSGPSGYAAMTEYSKQHS